jgi:uroporphyrinogen-III synthase
VTTGAGRKILLLRSGAPGPEDVAVDPDVLVLHTHEIVSRDEGIREALAFEAAGATLVVSSKETVRILVPLFRAPFARMIAVGGGTGDLLRKVNTGERSGRTSGGASTYSGAVGREGAEEASDGGLGGPRVVVPEIPGAAGVLHLLRNPPSAALGMRILWPRGSDAADEPLDELRSLGAQVFAPIVYEKRRRAFDSSDPAWSAFSSGEVSAVAVGSLAGLDALRGAVRASGRPLPPVRWGALGPETARAFAARGLPAPLVPKRPRLPDLIDLLRENLT